MSVSRSEGFVNIALYNIRNPRRCNSSELANACVHIQRYGTRVDLERFCEANDPNGDFWDCSEAELHEIISKWAESLRFDSLAETV